MKPVKQFLTKFFFFEFINMLESHNQFELKFER